MAERRRQGIQLQAYEHTNDSGTHQPTKGALLAAQGAEQFDCDHCALAVQPVCGDDAQWYQNECIAFCADVKVVDVAACKGESSFGRGGRGRRRGDGGGDDDGGTPRR